MRRLIALGMSFVVASSGCSFALVSGPPANHQQLPAFKCTTSRVGPILDGVFTGWWTLNLAATLVLDDQQWSDAFDGDPPAKGTAIGLYAALMAIGGAGMWYGLSRSGRCRDAKSQLAIRQSQNPGGTGTTPTWPPPPTAPAPAPTPTPTPTPTPVPDDTAIPPPPM